MKMRRYQYTHNDTTGEVRAASPLAAQMAANTEMKTHLPFKKLHQISVKELPTAEAGAAFIAQSQHALPVNPDSDL